MRNIFVGLLGEELTARLYDCMLEPVAAAIRILREEPAGYLKQPRQELIVEAFHAAVAELERQFGPDMGEWSWGKLHQVTMGHVFSGKPELGWLFSVGGEPAGGDPYTVNLSAYRLHDPFKPVAGPALRFAYDFGNPEGSLGMAATGNSGDPFSPHYSDQYAYYRDGKAKPFVGTAAAEEKEGCSGVKKRPGTLLVP